MAASLGNPIVSDGAEPSRVEGGGVPLDVGVAGGQLVDAQCRSVVWAGCWVVSESDLSSSDGARPGSERRQEFPEPRWASALAHHQVPCVLRLVLQRVHPHVWIVWHCRSHQQGGAAVSPRGLGWPGPTCTITDSAQRCPCSAAQVHWSSVVTNHTVVGTWSRGRRVSGCATSALGARRSPSASTSRRMSMRAAGGLYAAPC